MAQIRSSRIFRIFISSTFSDLKEERNALQEQVFPKLRELCMQYGCRFQAIDLRWGVSEEAARDQQTMNICFQELERCQHVTPKPNFVILLGDRYGWRPLPPQIEAGEFEAILENVSAEDKALLLWDERSGDGSGWYKKDENAIPAEYCLRPREVKVPDNASTDEKQATSDKEAKEWERLEKRLRSAILCALDQLGWRSDDPRRIKYEASATHQEILRGALGVPDAPSHVYCFSRQTKKLPADSRAGDFVDLNKTGYVDSEARLKLENLKQNLRKLLPRNIYEYKSSWTGDAITLDHLSKLCLDAYNALSGIIVEQAAALKKVDDLETELEAHDSFGEERARFFVGRASVQHVISNYLRGDNSHPLAVFGEAGLGKTALMAFTSKQARKDFRSAEVIFRSVGATPLSSDGRSLLESLCRQISRRYGADESTIPIEYQKLVEELPERLSLVTKQRPLIIFLDALDQISDTGHARTLSWLPANLPANVHLVVSCLPRECLSALQKKLPHHNILELKPMSPAEGEKLLDLWLKDANRTLQTHQRTEVLNKSQQSGRPLYLKLAFEEARRWKSYTGVIELSPDITGIINDLFKRLSSDANHGKLMVSHSLGYLAAARNGLSEDELLDMFSLDEEVISDFLRRSPRSPAARRLPVVVWSRLYYDLKPYLVERIVDEVPVIAFYHRQFIETILGGFLLGETKRRRHEALARFFGRQPLWIERGRIRTANLRKLSELPFHQTYGQMWSELESTLGDVEFATAKSETGLLFDLIRDYDRAIEAKDITSVAQVRRALLLEVPALSARPTSTAQVLYNQLVWYKGLDARLQTVLERARLRMDEQGYWIRTEAPLPGSHRSETRSISFEIHSGIQALSSDRKAIAIADQDGQIEIHYSSSGEPIEKRRLGDSQISGIALCEPHGLIAYIAADGMIHVEDSLLCLQGRKGEKVLAYHYANYILAVKEDGSIVAWHTNRNEIKVLDTNLPAPLTVLRMSPNGKNVFYVAGFKQQVMGIASYSATGWESKRLIYNGPSVIDADIDSDGNLILLATMDRALRILDAKTGLALAQLSYERRPEITLRGRPEKCVLGFGESASCAFVATHDGHIACWEWEEDVVVRLEDYRTVSEDIALIILDVISEVGQLFISTTDYGKVFTRQSLYDPVSRHTAAVSACVMTATGKIVSASTLDHTIRWFSASRLKPLGHQYYRVPTVVSPRGETDDVIIGDQEGKVWNQKPYDKVDPGDIFMAFAEEVVSLFYSGDGCAIAAGKSGRALQIHLLEDKVDIFWHSTGYQTQRKVLPAGQAGLFWSLRRDEIGGEFRDILALVKGRDRADIAFSSQEHINDAAVSRDGMTVCLTSHIVQLLRFSGRKWKVHYRRETPVNQVAFLGEDEMLAVALSGTPWLEVWQISEDLPTLAAILLNSDVSCLYTRGYNIVAGCRSGDLVSVKLSGQAIETVNIRRR